MRKLMYVLVGLILVGAAVALAGYRHVYEPKQRSARAPDAAVASRSLDRARPEATRSPPPAQRDARPAPPAKVDSIATFAAIVDVLNVAVGIVGIVLAIMGMRMQRQAMAMQASRVEDGRR